MIDEKAQQYTDRVKEPYSFLSVYHAYIDGYNYAKFYIQNKGFLSGFVCGLCVGSVVAGMVYLFLHYFTKRS